MATSFVFLTTQITTYKHKQPLLALSDTWDVNADHRHIVGTQGLCYTISRDHFGYGRRALSYLSMKYNALMVSIAMTGQLVHFEGICTLLILQTIYNAHRRCERRESGQQCTVCTNSWVARTNRMLPCDACNAGYHQLYMDPPLEALIPNLSFALSICYI